MLNKGVHKASFMKNNASMTLKVAKNRKVKLNKI